MNQNGNITVIGGRSEMGCL